MDKVAILIPAYEPDGKLSELVWNLRAAQRGGGRLGEPTLPGFTYIVVVDDGSTKPAAKAAFEEIRGQVDVVLVHAVNRGKGAALKTGFAWIRDHLPEVEVVVTADSDGQHTPKDIRRVASVARRHPEGLVLGVRRFKGKVPFRSQFGNMWARLFFRLLTGLSVADTQTGLRAIPRGLLARMLALPGDRYEYETRMLADARTHRAKLRQIPIETVYIDDNKSSHYRPLKDTWLTLRALWSARFEREGDN